MHTYTKALAGLALSLAFVPSTSRAAEGYDNCTGFIDALPAVIATQGTWCLRKDLSTSLSAGSAISIATNNVTIDCNDFKIGGLAAGPGTGGLGIEAHDRQNITVRNCNVRGFYAGIYLQGAAGGGHLVERNRLSSNTIYGIYVRGDGSTIEHNWVLDTGGATPGQGAAITGILGDGGVDIIDNLIAGVTSAPGSNQWAGGIAQVNNGASLIRGNRVSGLASDGTGQVTGIAVGSGPTIISDNQLFGPGAPPSTAFYCNSGISAYYRDNTAHGFATANHSCVDSGANLIVP